MNPLEIISSLRDNFVSHFVSKRTLMVSRMVAMDPHMSDAEHPGHPAFFDRVIPYFAHDVTFTLDQLAALNKAAY